MAKQMANVPRSLSGPINRRRNPNVEAIHDPAGHAWLDEGLAEFNAGRHWHAHEAWEHLWLGLEGDDKVFVQGLIMAAAMLHQYGRGVVRGVENHWANVQARLPQHAPQKWGIDVDGLLAQLQPFLDAARGGDLQQDPAAVRIVRKR